MLRFLFCNKPVLRIRIRLIRKILASWIRIQGVNINEKLQKKLNYSLNPKLNF